MGSIAAVANAADLAPCSAADLTANVQITAHTEAGQSAIRNAMSSSPAPTIRILSDGESIPTGDEVQHVKISPGKKVVISVEPCDSSEPAELSESAEEPTVIPQNIDPSLKTFELPDGEQDFADQLGTNRSIYDEMGTDDLEANMKNLIALFDLSRQARIGSKVTVPQLTFIGESDQLKGSLIERLTGIKADGKDLVDATATAADNTANATSDDATSAKVAAGVDATVTGADNTADTTAKSADSAVTVTAAPATAVTATSEAAHSFAYSMPVRFNLVKDSDPAAKPTVKVNGTEETRNLFTVLNALATKELVEVEIRSGAVAASMIFVDLPGGLSDPEKQKHLEHAWIWTVAIGSAATPFAEWETLKLARSYDMEMTRIVTVAISPDGGSGGALNRVKPIALGLRQGHPSMTMDKMFYIGISGVEVCGIASCGEALLTGGLQRKFLKMWSLLRPAALKIIQSELDDFEAPIRAHEEFQKIEPAGEKWGALIATIRSVLGDQLLFLTGDRDGQSCSKASVLDTIKRSIFRDKNSESVAAPQKVSFQELFKNYQMAISKLFLIPAETKINEIRSAIEELRERGPKQATISKLESLVFTPQIEALREVRSDFLVKIEAAWQAAVQRALGSKFALEPYDQLKNQVTSASELVLQDQLKEIRGINSKIDSTDDTSKWIFNFNKSSDINANIWIELMRNNSTDEAIKAFYDNASTGFTYICTVQAALQVRLVIENLLTSKTLVSILEKAEKSDHASLMEMSVRAKNTIQQSNELITKLSESIKIEEAALA